jgi:hypothetical protein
VIIDQPWIAQILSSDKRTGCTARNFPPSTRTSLCLWFRWASCD